MKRTLLALAMLMFCSTINAYEQLENPDRKISFGLSYDHQWQNSDWSFGSAKINDFSKTTWNSILADVKIPMSSVFTFQLRGGYIGSNGDFFTGENVKANGYDIGVGIRFYLP